MACKFFEMLDKRWDAGKRVCVGLDSDWKKMPTHLQDTHGGYPDVSTFNRLILEATADLALCYKPNIAFYSGVFQTEAQDWLEQTIDDIREIAPGTPVILDAKRADIGNTNAGYVDEAFVNFDTDAVTVNPYFGIEAMQPFLEQKDKGVIVLCKTSNPGGGEFQDLEVVTGYTGLGYAETLPFYQVVARNVVKNWNRNGNCALVVGATYPDQLGQVRKIVGDMPILIPGIGTQGGDLEGSVRNGVNSKKRGIIINSSSGIIFSKDPRAATQKLTDDINSVLKTL